MERQDIQKRVQTMNNREDLLSLINDLMDEEYGQRQHRRFTMRQLERYCNPNITHGRFKHFDIPKKSGKEPRHITAPVSALRLMLHYVNIILQAHYGPKPCVMGFVPGRCVVDGANLHTNKNYVYNIDLKDFFPSVHRERVWARLQYPPFNFKGERRVLADTIAGLCSMKTDEKDDQGRPVYVLPQGAPTSPILTNIICERLDYLLTALAKRFHLTYSRYADDITFSSMHNVYQRDGAFVKELERIIADQGFRINPDKTRLCRVNKRQEVTGLTVNEKPNVTRKYIQDIRCALHIWEKYGYEEARRAFLSRYREEKGHVKKSAIHIAKILEGKLNYLKMVKGVDDATYKKLRERFGALNPKPKKKRALPAVEEHPASLADTLSQLVAADFTNLEILLQDGA